MTNSEQDSVATLALKLMIKKGGTLRLRTSELESVADYVMTIAPNPDNPGVMHLGIMTRQEAEARIVAAIAALPPEPKGDNE